MTTETVKPADAALVREIAHDRAFEGASWHRIDSEVEAVLSAEAARLHALADILEKITPLNVHLLNRVLDMGCTCGVVTTDDRRDYDAAIKRLPELIAALEALTK